MSARVFRLHVGVNRTANSGGGDWKLYDDLDDLRHALVAAYVDLLIHRDRGQDPRRPIARLWRKRFRGDTETYPHVSNIFNVEQLVDGRWVELMPEFIDPDVIIGGIQ